MKHTLLSLVAAAATTFAANAQITLGDAYTCLAELHPMATSSAKTVNVDGCNLSNTKCATASNYKGQTDMMSEFIYTVESLPIRQQVFSANNGEEMVVVYAAPKANGLYDVLILESDADNGNYTAYYGQTDKAGVNALGSSRVTMDGNSLQITTNSSNSLAQLVID